MQELFCMSIIEEATLRDPWDGKSDAAGRDEADRDVLAVVVRAGLAETRA